MTTTVPTRLRPARGALRRPRVAIAAAVLLAVAASAVAAARLDGSGRSSAPPPRPDLQRLLDEAVTGPDRLAPGAVAYVRGPRGTWLGSAGVANVATSEPMRPDARMRLESVGKIFTATIVHQLAEEGTLSLDDTLERWLPGMFPHAGQVTLAQLLTHRSGLVDDNVVATRPDYYLSLIEDPAFRAELRDLRRRAAADPAIEFSPLVWVRIAAAVPPLFPPGVSYRYSNTGFLVLGLVASRATGQSLPALYRERIFRPLGLRATAWDPQGTIAGPHARGYYAADDGTPVDATERHGGKGADGGIVSNATETARFLTGLMTGELLGRRQLFLMKNGGFWTAGDATGCAGLAYGHGGAGSGFKTNVWAGADGSRVAVLLLNGRGDERADEGADDLLGRLYCAG